MATLMMFTRLVTKNQAEHFHFNDQVVAIMGMFNLWPPVIFILVINSVTLVTANFVIFWRPHCFQMIAKVGISTLFHQLINQSTEENYYINIY